MKDNMITDTAYWEPDIERLSRQDMVALQQHKLTALGQRLAALRAEYAVVI